jgi:hypothetical protein
VSETTTQLHDWALDEDGKVDTFALNIENHNGPHCLRCDQYICHHCKPDCYTEACPGPQP